MTSRGIHLPRLRLRKLQIAIARSKQNNNKCNKSIRGLNSDFCNWTSVSIQWDNIVDATFRLRRVHATTDFTGSSMRFCVVVLYWRLRAAASSTRIAHTRINTRSLVVYRGKLKILQIPLMRRNVITCLLNARVIRFRWRRAAKVTAKRRNCARGPVPAFPFVFFGHVP